MNRWPHVPRLALFAAFLLTLFYFVAVSRVVDVGGARRRRRHRTGGTRWPHLLVAAVLAAVFVPGPLLAAGSGFLFGPLVGTFVTLGSTVTTAMITALVGRHAGRESARALLRSGLGRAHRQPDPSAAGCGRSSASASSRESPTPWPPTPSARSGMPLWQMAIGAFIGSAPRAFVYTALGISISDLLAAGLRGDRGLVCHRDHRRVRGPPGVSQLARAQPVMATVADRNVLGGDLEPCGNDPVTGFYHDGCCSTGPEDIGLHHLRGGDRGFWTISARSATTCRRRCPQYQFPGSGAG